jgi:hypothetical protein
LSGATNASLSAAIAAHSPFRYDAPPDWSRSGISFAANGNKINDLNDQKI